MTVRKHAHLVMDETPQPKNDPDRPPATLTWLMVNPQLRADIQRIASKQQLAIAVGIANGAAMTEIANMLRLSLGNVNTQRQRLGAKLQALTSQRRFVEATHNSVGTNTEPVVDPSATTHKKGYDTTAETDLVDRTPGHDPERMRNIPVLGAGLAVVPGTDPAQGVYKAELAAHRFKPYGTDNADGGGVPTTPLRGYDLELLENLYGDRELSNAINRAHQQRRATPKETHAVLQAMVRAGTITVQSANRVMQLRYQWTKHLPEVTA